MINATAAGQVIDDYFREYIDPRQALIRKNSGGFDFFNIIAPAIKAIPFSTPFLKMLARTGGGAGERSHWRIVREWDKSGQNVINGRSHRGGVISTSADEVSTDYKQIGLEYEVLFSEFDDAKGFEDLLKLRSLAATRALYLGHERQLIGGNCSLPLGTTPTPTLSLASGGSLSGTVSVICVALSYGAFKDGNVAGTKAGMLLNYTRTSPDQKTKVVKSGMAIQSAAASQAVSGGNLSLQASVASVKGAFGYAWFWGTAGSERLGAITPINSIKITAPVAVVAAGTGRAVLASGLPNTDDSTDPDSWDSIITQMLLPTSNAVTYDAGGVAFSGSGGANSVQLDKCFEMMQQNFQLSPEYIFMSPRTHKSLNDCIINNGGAPLLRINANLNLPANGAVGGTPLVDTVINGFNGQTVSIVSNPHLPEGMVVGWSNQIANIIDLDGPAVDFDARRDFFQEQWPRLGLSFTGGVYVDGTPRLKVPSGFFLMNNVAV